MYSTFFASAGAGAMGAGRVPTTQAVTLGLRVGWLTSTRPRIQQLPLMFQLPPPIMRGSSVT